MGEPRLSKSPCGGCKKLGSGRAPVTPRHPSDRALFLSETDLAPSARAPHARKEHLASGEPSQPASKAAHRLHGGDHSRKKVVLDCPEAITVVATADMHGMRAIAADSTAGIRCTEAIAADSCRATRCRGHLAIDVIDGVQSKGGVVVAVIAFVQCEGALTAAVIASVQPEVAHSGESAGSRRAMVALSGGAVGT